LPIKPLAPVINTFSGFFWLITISFNISDVTSL
jgi:hypothetical protein